MVRRAETSTEQIALLNGEVKVGEKFYKLEDVIGERDHTHGVRDWTGIGDWLYYVVVRY